MRALFRLIGCLGLILLLAAGWLYRDRIVDFARGILHKRPTLSGVCGRLCRMPRAKSTMRSR